VKHADYHMRLPDKILHCVCFMHGPPLPDGTPLWVGTGFLVGVVEEGITHVHLVTARHVVEDLRVAQWRLFVRLNKSWMPGAEALPSIELDHDEWVYPEDEGDRSADIAVSLLPDVPNWNTYVIPLAAFVTDAVLATEQYSIGIGDEIAVIGLYTPVPGTARSYPIVRAGIIAAMPNEPIYDPKQKERYDAYLVELHSTGGLSGSPVWLALTGSGRNANGSLNHLGQHLLLGLVRHGWDHEGPSVPRKESAKYELNMGITAVTPIRPLVAMLNSNKMRERRAAQRAELGQTGLRRR
jgi:hypothetical protein